MTIRETMKAAERAIEPIAEGAETCPDCAGLGYAWTNQRRYHSGALKSVTFSLHDACRTCGGSGVASTIPRYEGSPS